MTKSNSIRKNSDRVHYLVHKIAESGSDPLKDFVAGKFKDELEQLQKQNIENVFEYARTFGIRYIYIGKGEIAGCEGIRYSGWPAIWSVVEKSGLGSSCGNTDQYQTSDTTGVLFPDGYYGAWDLTKNLKLSDAQTEKKKFKKVVTRARNREYA